MVLSRFSKKSKIKKIGKEFQQQVGRIAMQLSKGRRNEEEARRWCVDLLKSSAMGYKEEDIETEARVLGKRVDIALKDDGRIFMVIECKAATVNINGNAINQAASYAVGLGAEWAAVTNGHNWCLYHVSSTKGVEPDITEIFDISILDEDGVSEDDSYFLYLLTKSAIETGETKRIYHEANCASTTRVKSAVLSDESIALICKKLEDDYRKRMGVSVIVDKEEIYGYLSEIMDLVE
ncbi:Type I restriction enzyme R protein N terminus (HSDR_N) [Nitrosomonas marina]|uniref:Type I restriction enzyme R protein N terminus (HSDR_N) n=1 Tax=Nitrosomonas marina TaxID=917 RepID=A0A1I0E8G4_9PROT|nr:type I restriction enzyme HsdR N-terminal domain-containing protein [Nitrosomonas marina]SET40619.1 Type I restriction enzyme R protein N terminus (HSDR_N) [Nitrosomonas marina]